MKRTFDKTRKHFPEPDGHRPPPPPPTPMMLINEISRMFHNRLRHETEGMLNMNNSCRMLLTHLSWKDGKTQLELANEIHMRPPTVSVALQKLESFGYVTRQTDQSDMRQIRVYLTEKGFQHNDLIKKCLEEAEKTVMNGITEEEAAEVERILLKMRENFRIAANNGNDNDVDEI